MKLLKKRLKNGIRVVYEQRDLPLVSLSITNKFGSAYETSEVKGIAHFIEHMLFTGTETRTNEQISREIEKKGGLLNAFTAHEVTSFWFKLPSEYIFIGLEILTDMLKNPLFDKEKFDKEKKVILEEIKMYHDNPRSAVFEQIEKNLFEKPFGELIIGNKETISSLNRDKVYSYFSKVYSPENYIVTIVGSADFNKVCDYLEKDFSQQNKKIELIKIKKKNSETIEERPGIDQAHFVFATHAPLYSNPNFPALKVLDAYLGDGMSSRLFLEIREKRGLAYAVNSSVDCEKSYCYYSIYVGTTKSSIQEVKKLILKEFSNVEKISENELKEAKTRAIGLKKVTSEESVNVMNNLMYAELNGNAKEYYNYEEKINAITLEQVKKLSRVLIENYSTSSIVPK